MSDFINVNYMGAKVDRSMRQVSKKKEARSASGTVADTFDRVYISKTAAARKQKQKEKEMEEKVARERLHYQRILEEYTGWL